MPGALRQIEERALLARGGRRVARFRVLLPARVLAAPAARAPLHQALPFGALLRDLGPAIDRLARIDALAALGRDLTGARQGGVAPHQRGRGNVDGRRE
ncbi:MAG: hypothetical protein HY812_14850 [Planctomycetes bacterium]|nr:hypothetical protein [Planctomycetota bacterium]